MLGATLHGVADTPGVLASPAPWRLGDASSAGYPDPPERLPRNRIHATPGPRQHGATGTGTGTGTGTVAQDDAAAREQRGAVRPPKRMASPGGSPIRPEGLRGKLRRRGATPACALPTRGKWAATNASAGGHRPCSQAQPPRLLPPVPSLPTFPTASLDLTSDLISLVPFPGTCTAACCHNGVVGRFVGRFTPGAGSAGRIARTVQRSSGVWGRGRDSTTVAASNAAHRPAEFSWKRL